MCQLSYYNKYNSPDGGWMISTGDIAAHQQRFFVQWFPEINYLIGPPTCIDREGILLRRRILLAISLNFYYDGRYYFRKSTLSVSMLQIRKKSKYLACFVSIKYIKNIIKVSDHLTPVPRHFRVNSLHQWRISVIERLPCESAYQILYVINE